MCGYFKILVGMEGGGDFAVKPHSRKSAKIFPSRTPPPKLKTHSNRKLPVMWQLSIRKRPFMYLYLHQVATFSVDICLQNCRSCNSICAKVGEFLCKVDSKNE
jgi:hypothetical protein